MVGSRRAGRHAPPSGNGIHKQVQRASNCHEGPLPTSKGALCYKHSRCVEFLIRKNFEILVLQCTVGIPPSHPWIYGTLNICNNLAKCLQILSLLYLITHALSRECVLMELGGKQ